MYSDADSLDVAVWPVFPDSVCCFLRCVGVDVVVLLYAVSVDEGNSVFVHGNAPLSRLLPGSQNKKVV